MKHHFKRGLPTIRNRAAVIHFDVTFRFISKEQCDLFVAEYVKNNEYPSITVDTVPGDSLELNIYRVTITDIPWANNLTQIAKLAEKYDYNSLV